MPKNDLMKIWQSKDFVNHPRIFEKFDPKGIKVKLKIWPLCILNWEQKLKTTEDKSSYLYINLNFHGNIKNSTQLGNISKEPSRFEPVIYTL